MSLKIWPSDFTQYDIRKFGAKVDGLTDDTAALQEAMWALRKDVNVGTRVDYFYPWPKLVFVPKGVLLISNQIDWIGSGIILIGQGLGQTIIKLKNYTVAFSDANSPFQIIKTPDGIHQFKNYIRDLSIFTGKGNPGAIAIDFVANNSGGIINVHVRDEGNSKTGIALNRYAPGPMMIKNVYVEGFDTGIDIGKREYSITMENIRLRRQRKAGIVNNGNIIQIDGLTSTNLVPAVINNDSTSMTTILNGVLIGGKITNHAIQNDKGHLYVRNTTSAGYAGAIQSGTDKIADTYVEEFHTGANQNAKSLQLNYSASPDYYHSDMRNWTKLGMPATWASSFALGKPIAYLPTQHLSNPRPVAVSVPTSLRKITGFGSVMFGNGTITLVIDQGDATSNPLIVEHWGHGISIDHRCARPLVIRHTKVINHARYEDSGDLFLEDVEHHIPLEIFPGQKVIARQLNMEGVQRIFNYGGQLWVMGLKTERKGAVITTTDFGETELLGGLLYPIQPFALDGTEEAAFISENSYHSLVFGCSNYKPDAMYPVLVEEDGAVAMPGRMNAGRIAVPMHTNIQFTPEQIAAIKSRA